MKFRSLGYCFSQGLKSIGRNRIFSLASVATMALCIFILGLFYSITSNVSYMVEQMEETLCVRVFFDEGVTEERIESIGNSLKEIDGVTATEYTSADEAWEKYKDRYFGDYKELANGYEDDNPLQNSASYDVYFDDASTQARIVSEIEKIDGIRRVNSSEVTADSLSEISRLIGVISLVVLLILFAIALFLISNTVAIGISVRNDEIEIMRLLGARNAFIKAPFIVEGVIIGVVGAAVPLVLVYFAYGRVVNYVLESFSFLSSILTFMPVGELFAVFIPVALVLGVGLGFIGSIFSLAKHLKA